MTEKEPPWVTALVDQRLALMKDKMGRLGFALIKSQMGLIMTPLTEPNEDASQAEFERWDQSCDKCGKHAPGQLWNGTVERTVWDVKIYFTFGACAQCAGKEQS